MKRKVKVIVMLSLAPTLLGCGHDPNHGIDQEAAQAAARRVHAPPDPEALAKMKPGHGG